MKKKQLLHKENHIVRVLDVQKDRILVIDCVKLIMPTWISRETIEDYCEYKQEDFYEKMGFLIVEDDTLGENERRIMYERYSIIVGILPFISHDKMRGAAIAKIADERNITKKTIRTYLCRYLAFNHIQSLLPRKNCIERGLTPDEKNMRWSLNKYFYNKNRNSLKMAYIMMLKEKYCDESGELKEQHPTYYQYRYFYRKHRKLQNYYIAREGLTTYQREYRPLLGENIQAFAPCPGVGMIDGTVCDIYLVDESGKLVGRPLLTICVDAYSGLCLGYSLSWEGGMYSLRNLILNVISDKVEHCKKHGIIISSDVWNNSKMPFKLVSDQGSEYTCDTFSQLTELGVQITNLPPYRPELKSWVELLFRLLQDTYKRHLKNKGVIEIDYQERGAHDYRKDACLTLEQFEQIVIRCIVYHNSKRIASGFPYTEKMLEEKIKPHSNAIWQWGLDNLSVELINVSAEQVVLTLLPRTNGKFTRKGLIVNNLRYYRENYTEQYLAGESVRVAYNLDNTSIVWLLENGRYIPFQLIEKRFAEKAFDAVEELKQKQKQMSKDAQKDSLQAEIELARSIEIVANMAKSSGTTSIKGIRENRKKEQRKKHIDYVREVGAEDGLE